MTIATIAEITIGVKASYEHEIRRVSLKGNTTFSALREVVSSLFSLNNETVVIKYKDDDEDLITMVYSFYLFQYLLHKNLNYNAILCLFIKETTMFFFAIYLNDPAYCLCFFY